MIIDLREQERLDDLQRGGYRIIQDTRSFCFGMDAVLLSSYASVRPGEKVLDLGTGTGVIMLLMDGRLKGGFYTGLEIQEEMSGMARRSVALNGLEDCMEIITGDIREAGRLLGRASFDVVVSNPPYMDDAGGLKNPNPSKAAARHEVFCTLEDVLRGASDALKPGGRFYLVHRPRRLSGIMSGLVSKGLEPKRIRMVHPRAGKDANLVLIESVRCGRPFLRVEPPLFVYERPGVYTEELKALYGWGGGA